MKKISIYLSLLGIIFFCLDLVPVILPAIPNNSLVSLNNSLEIILLAPLMVIITYKIYKSFINTGNLDVNMRNLKFSFFSSVYAYIVGATMHFTANSIHAVYQEIESTNLIYIYDEYISHPLIFGPIFLILIISCLIQVKFSLDENILKSSKIILGVSGGLLGFNLSLGSIEGQCPWVSWIFSIILIILCIYYNRKQKKKLAKNPAIYYGIIVSIITLIFLIIYLLIFGSYIQPSEFLL
ncbi:MAG: hypothetical protein EU547_02610 [Promethearchaeota archaeon]|nr:MAG: hypothetical protein EU547_02610 [Candidatus Lokiarchaeota archaeon]